MGCFYNHTEKSRSATVFLQQQIKCDVWDGLDLRNDSLQSKIIQYTVLSLVTVHEDTSVIIYEY